MKPARLSVAAIIAGQILFLSVWGCAAEKRDADLAAEIHETQESDSPRTVSDAAPHAADDEDVDEQLEKLTRKRRKLDRELDIARNIKVEKAQLDLRHAVDNNTAEISKTQRALRLARAKLETFEKKTAPTRIAKGQLGLKRAADRLLEARQELEQLELMYSEEQIADKTKEIVLERARRNLERSGQNLEIQQTEFATLTDDTLVHEKTAHQNTIFGHERQIERLTHDMMRTRLDKRAAIKNAIGEIERLEFELADLDKEEAKLKAKKEKAADDDDPEEDGK